MIQIYLLQKSMKKINWLEYQELTPEERKRGGGNWLYSKSEFSPSNCQQLNPILVH